MVCALLFISADLQQLLEIDDNVADEGPRQGSTTKTVPLHLAEDLGGAGCLSEHGLFFKSLLNFHRLL